MRVHVYRKKTILDDPALGMVPGVLLTRGIFCEH